MGTTFNVFYDPNVKKRGFLRFRRSEALKIELNRKGQNGGISIWANILT